MLDLGVGGAGRGNECGCCRGLYGALKGGVLEDAESVEESDGFLLTRHNILQMSIPLDHLNVNYNSTDWSGNP